MIHKIFELAAAAAAKDVFRLHAATIIQPTLHNLLQNPLSVFGIVAIRLINQPKGEPNRTRPRQTPPCCTTLQNLEIKTGRTTVAF